MTIPPNNPFVIVATAVAAVLSAAVGLAGVLIPDLTVELRVAIITLGESVIALFLAIVLLLNTTSSSTPTLAEDTEVKVITPGDRPNYTTVV